METMSFSHQDWNEDGSNGDSSESKHDIYVSTHHKQPEQLGEKRVLRYSKVCFHCCVSTWMLMNGIGHHHCDQRDATKLPYQGLDDPDGKC